LHEILKGSISYTMGKSNGLGNVGISTFDVTISEVIILTIKVKATHSKGVII
jgi:hypothetical protein